MKPVDEFDLELLEAGEPLDPERRAAALADPSLGPARAELEAMKTWWERARPELARPRFPARQLAAALLAVALALLVVWGAWPGAPAVRAMGPPGADIWRVRDGQPVEPSAPVLQGDQLSVTLVPQEAGWLTVATLQQDGVVSLLVEGEELLPGRRFELPGRVELDAYAGREWLVVWTHARPLRPDALRRELGSLLPEPEAHEGEDKLVLEVTRGRSPR